MYTIRLNNKSFDCDPNEFLVNSALKQGVFLEHSCLSGRCSSCKVQVLAGESEAAQEEQTLSAAEKDQKYILACIRKPLSDLTINSEDLSEYGLEKPKTIPVKINTITKLTEEILHVSLRYPPSQQFPYLPGQYIDIINGAIKRSYSISNAPNQETIELIIKNYQGGAMSDYWFNQAKVNDLLRVHGPKGTFFLRRSSQKSNLILLATGTGIAPIKAILEYTDNLELLKEFDHILVFWGMRYALDVFWKPELCGLPISFIPVLSREKEMPANQRYVQHRILNQQIDYTKAVVYACGSNDMILAAREGLIKAGLAEQDFFSDAFVTSN